MPVGLIKAMKRTLANQHSCIIMNIPNTITTTTVLWPFVRDYPGEAVSEETFTHEPS